MKKILLLSIAISLAGITSAQKTAPGYIYWPTPSGENYNSMVIPKEFAYNNKPLLTFIENTNRNHLMVYDENIDLIKSFDIDNSKEFTYTLTYQKEIREVTSVTENGLEKQDLCKSFSKWLEQQKLYDSSIEQSLIITKQENGDSIISVDYSKQSSSYSSNSVMYFCYNYFGLKYPKLYWIASNGSLYECRTSYTVAYSDWKPTGETEDFSYSQKQSLIYLYNMNLDNVGGLSNGTYFEISQTLFNQDEDFEYLIPKYALVQSEGHTILNPSKDDNIETTRSTIISEKSTPAIVGFQVVSSNGNIVKEINFDDGFYIFELNRGIALITIGGNRYLTASNSRETLFYKIDSQSADIKKVKSAKGSMFLYPTIANKNSSINVTLGDANENGSTLDVYSTSGQKVKSFNVPAGLEQTQISISAPAGVYHISRVQKGKNCDTKNIILK